MCESLRVPFITVSTILLIVIFMFPSSKPGSHDHGNTRKSGRGMRGKEKRMHAYLQRCSQQRKRRCKFSLKSTISYVHKNAINNYYYKYILHLLMIIMNIQNISGVILL